MSDLQRTVAALTSPIRREILWMVWERERPAGEIAAAFDVSAPTISTHLAALRDAGLVTMRVDGNFRRYLAVPEAVATVRSLLASEDSRWQVADNIPERELATADTMRLVEAEVLVPAPRRQVFDAFVDAAVYSQWMGVPVRIHDGEFACTLEWGTEVRGRYEVVAPPSLIAMRWDFRDDTIPVPGEALVGYLRFEAESDDDSVGSCRVIVHQHARDATQAEFMSVAWSMVLGRLKQHFDQPAPRRGPRRARPKRQTP